MDFNGLLHDSIRKAQQGREDIIKEAFIEHFGMPIETIDDTENLEHIVVRGEPISSYRYRGETFLYLKDDLDFSFNGDADRRSFTLTVSYYKV